jgi:hypothetical protein
MGGAIAFQAKWIGVCESFPSMVLGDSLILSWRLGILDLPSDTRIPTIRFPIHHPNHL